MYFTLVTESFHTDCAKMIGGRHRLE